MKSGFFILTITQLFFSGCIDRNGNQKEDEFAEKVNKLVLSENKIGEEYFFKKISSKEILEYKIKYLGSIKTLEGDSLRFLINTVFTGLYEDSKRASCTVNIYGNKNKKIGYYYVGGDIGAPQKVEGSNLIFSYNNDKCNQVTSINFKDSIPRQIFVSCTKEGGDFYTLINEQK